VSTLSDLPYDEHRRIVVVALGFFALGVAVVPLRRIRVSSSELGADQCEEWFISFDGKGRVRHAISPGGG
jgi:hypothetical protein